MSRTITKQLQIKDGIVRIGAKETLLVSGEYPYYRDKKSNWRDRLQKIKASGVTVVTSYVPWRHHLVHPSFPPQYFVPDPSGTQDKRWGGKEGGAQNLYSFGDQQQENADLLHFLALCQELELYTILKPGPFIKGGTQFGGLPDYLSPTAGSTHEPILSAEGQQIFSQNLALPAPLDAGFVKEVNQWFEALWQEVFKPHLAPKGPIIALQIGNEGIYSDSMVEINAYDYSESSQHHFRAFLGSKYGDLAHYNATHETSFQDWSEIRPPFGEWASGRVGEGAKLGLPSLNRLAKIRQFGDWGEWSAHYLETVYRHWLAPLEQVPIKFFNPAPPNRADRFTKRPGTQIDVWLSRVQPEKITSAAYGFSSWVGNAVYDDEAFTNYVLAAKRSPGPNLEENWGFVYKDKRYGSPICGVYHALLALGAGATGFNVYNICGTAHWSSDLVPPQSYIDTIPPRTAVKYKPPYCPDAPISIDGEIGAKFEVLQLLTRFLSKEGETLLRCQSQAQVAWGTYLPYSYLAAWEPSGAEIAQLGRLPIGGMKTLVPFAEMSLQNKIPFDMVDLERASNTQLANYKVIMLAGSIFMAASVQQALLDFVVNGGTLILLHEVPYLDEAFQPCTLLKETLFNHHVRTPEGPRKILELQEIVTCRDLEVKAPAQVILQSDEAAHGYEVSHGAGRAVYIDTDQVSTSFGLSQKLATFLRPYLAGFSSFGTQAEQTESVVVFERQNPSQSVRYLFFLSRSDHGERLRYPIDGDTLCVEIDLAPRGCAIIKLDPQGFAGAFIKGVNEISNEAVPLHLRYKGSQLSSTEACDAVILKENGDWLWKVASTSATCRIDVQF